MATTMDIRLDYGAWPGEDDAETTAESTSSDDGSPPYNSPHQVGRHQLESSARRQHSSALPLSDLFSDSGLRRVRVSAAVANLGRMVSVRGSVEGRSHVHFGVEEVFGIDTIA